MDVMPVDSPFGGSASRLTLRAGSGRYPILSQSPDSCLILAPAGTYLRGYADIFDGDEHQAHCLILLSAPEGDFIRLTFKRRTRVLPHPPADYATGDSTLDPFRVDPAVPDERRV